MDTAQQGELVAYAPEQPSPLMTTASTSGASSSDVAKVVDPLEYLHLAGMIGAIRSAPDDLEWVDRESNPGPQFRTGETDVLRALKQLDIRVPIPVGHFLTISEAANDKLLQHYQKNQKRFTYQRIQRMLKKKEGGEEVTPPEPEAARTAPIPLAEKDHFVQAQPVLWKSAKCDCEVWGKLFNALIDTGSSAVAISLDTIRKTGRLGSILPQFGKDNYVFADEEAMNIVDIIENVAVKVGRVHVLVNALVIDVTWTRTSEHPTCLENLELLIIQAWRTNVEGDLLGFLFGSVRPGHRQLIAQELITSIVQLADDLSPDIVSQSDDSLAPHVLTRTLDPYLQWSACLEEPGGEDSLPSWKEYLKPYGIIDHAFHPKAEEVAIEEVAMDEEESDGDEETWEEGSYSEYSEGEESEEEEEEEETGSEWEALPEEATHTDTEAEDPEAARKREEIATGKRQLEFARGASLRISDDPTRDQEPPKPEDGDPAAATPSTSRRRRSRSSSPSSPTRPPVRPRTDAGVRGIGLRPRMLSRRPLDYLTLEQIRTPVTFPRNPFPPHLFCHFYSTRLVATVYLHPSLQPAAPTFCLHILLFSVAWEQCNVIEVYCVAMGTIPACRNYDFFRAALFRTLSSLYHDYLVSLPHSGDRFPRFHRIIRYDELPVMVEGMNRYLPPLPPRHPHELPAMYRVYFPVPTRR
ncbi:hypothetical protein CBR_g84837 [Chara braunii]|uniref:Uncharacterized protein n=1 Tax=Chara braunii TaxID=69332 RepID=A0A388KB45_CHABU|nr:hypothetical protein CBR_g84837 [Chara braunii]|eukprot:GBG67173.1 hypothetical protein CBR_g84837 [Chara braunii]